MASPSRALAPAGGLGIGEEDTGDCDQGVGDVFWRRGGTQGFLGTVEEGGHLTGWTQDVQSGHVWGVRSVALGQASSTDCGGGVGQCSGKLAPAPQHSRVMRKQMPARRLRGALRPRLTLCFL